MKQEAISHPPEQWLALAATADLGWWRAMRLRRHAAECRDCADLIREYGDLAGELAGLPIPQAPVGLAAAVLSQIPSSATAPATTPDVPFFAVPSFAGAAAVFAVSMVAAALMVLGSYPPPAPAPQVKASPLPQGFQLPDDSPLEVVRVDYGDSSGGGDRQGPLSLTLKLRNRSPKPVEGLAMTLSYPSGMHVAMASPAASGVHLAPGESMDLPASVPANRLTSPSLALDAVLFQDGSAYGPDQYGNLAPLRINRAEAARDRLYLESLAAAGATEGLSHVAGVLQHWEENDQQQARNLPRTLVGPRAEMLRSHALPPARIEIVSLAGAPLEIVSAEASFAEGRLLDPQVEVRNAGQLPVKDFQVIWVFREASGTEYRGRISSSARRSEPLAPGERARIAEPIVFEANGKGRPQEIVSARVFLRAAGYADESGRERVWVPERAVLEAQRVGAFLPLSSETTRLWSAYRQRGTQALLAELFR